MSNFKMTFFGFPEVKWLHATGEVDESVRCSRQISQDLTCQKSLNRFLTVIQKFKKRGRFSEHSV